MGNSKIQQKDQNSPLQKSQFIGDSKIKLIGDSRNYQDEPQIKVSRIDKVYQECDTYS